MYWANAWFTSVPFTFKEFLENDKTLITILFYYNLLSNLLESDNVADAS